MIEERDALISHVWPELRKLCRERSIELVDVDLRWGITEEQSTRKDTLKLCLDEIRACRPYFIGLIGDRYGWIPGEDCYTADVMEEHPWLKRLDQRSVTELEMLHGVLNNPSMAGRAFFYFRDSKYANSVPPDKRADFISENPNSAKRLTALKKLIRSKCAKNQIPLFEDYPDPRNLATLVLSDLKTVIEAQYPKKGVVRGIDREEVEHEAFAEMRRLNYVERPCYFDELDKYASSDGGPLIVLGESGNGKSTLLANWLVHWQATNPGDLIFQHYIGGASDSTDHWRLIGRLIETMQRWLGETHSTPSTKEFLIRDLPLWLVKARAKATRGNFRIIFVIDGLDRLENENHALRLGWIPENAFSGPLRLIASTTSSLTERPNSEEPLLIARKRGWNELHVRGLVAREREELITVYLARFSKRLDKHRVQRLALSQATENPLYLRILLEDLRVTGTHDRLDERICNYQNSRSIHGLIQHVLERYQRDYERDRPCLVSEALSLIYSARRGLSESELLHLMRPTGQSQMAPTLWAPLRNAMEEMLIDRGGVLNFAHNHLRDAVAAAFKLDEARCKLLRRRLTEYFEEQPMSARSTDELPWLFQQLGDNEKLRRCILEIPRFQMLFHGQPEELLSYWTHLCETGEMGTKYLEAFTHWENAHPDIKPYETAWNANELATFLYDTNHFATAEILYKQALECLEKEFGIAAPETTVCLRGLAKLFRRMDRLEESVLFLRRAMEIDSHNPKQDESLRSKNLAGFALSLHLCGKLEEAGYHMEQALEIDRRGQGSTSLQQYVEHLVALADIMLDLGRTELASRQYQEALNLAEQNGDLEKIACLTGRQASLLHSQGNSPEAEKLYSKSIEMLSTVYGPESAQLADQLNNLGCLLVEGKRHSEAEPLLLRGFNIKQTQLGENHREVGKACSNLASVFDATSRGNKAEVFARRATAIFAAIPSGIRNEADYATALNILAIVLAKDHKLEEATKSWSTAINALITERHNAGRLHPSVPTIITNFIRGLEGNGVEPDKIVEHLRKIFSEAHALELLPTVMKSLGTERHQGGNDAASDKGVPIVDQKLLPAELQLKLRNTHALIARHVGLHLDRVAHNKVVPASIIQFSKDAFSWNSDGIALQLIRSIEGRKDILRLKCTAPNNPVLLVVSIFLCSKHEAMERLCSLSKETGLGYISLITEIFNDWPSPELKALFHLVICLSDSEFDCHTGLFDMEGKMKTPMKFCIVPVELLSAREQEVMAPRMQP